MTDENHHEVMLSDASGSWGCGATWKGKWFQIEWSEATEAKDWSIMPKELLPIVVAAAVWGKHWKGSVVKARCDNMAVVASSIQSCTCKERKAMHLMRCLAFIEARVPVMVVAEHIKGSENVVADALSRDRLDLARSVMQGSEREAEAIPKDLLEMLTAESRSWSER